MVYLPSCVNLYVMGTQRHKRHEKAQKEQRKPDATRARRVTHTGRRRASRAVEARLLPWYRSTAPKGAARHTLWVVDYEFAGGGGLAAATATHMLTKVCSGQFFGGIDRDD